MSALEDEHAKQQVQDPSADGVHSRHDERSTTAITNESIKMLEMLRPLNVGTGVGRAGGFLANSFDASALRRRIGGRKLRPVQGQDN